MDLSNDYQLIEGHHEAIHKLHVLLRRKKIPHTVVKLRYTTGAIKGGYTPALKVSRAVYQSLLGQ